MNNEIISADEPEFLPEEKLKWFSEKDFCDYIGIDKSSYKINPSYFANQLDDRTITLSFKAAIEINSECFNNKVVLEIGSGLGLYSLLAAENGASKVYALETNLSLVKYSKKIVEENNYQSIIKIINKSVFDVYFNEKIDIIICCWMGNFLTQNSIIKEVIYARDNFLSKNGFILPDKATLYLCGIEDVKYKNEKLSMWNDIYGIDMSCIKNESLCSPLNENFEKKRIISTLCPIYKVDMYNIKDDDLNFSNQYELYINKNDYFSGFGAWFDVEFSKLPNKIKFTTSPYNVPTRYNQYIFYIENDIQVNKGDYIKGSICSRIDEKDNSDIVNVKISFNFIKRYKKNINNNLNGIQLYKIYS